MTRDRFMPWLIGAVAGGVVAGMVLVGVGTIALRNSQHVNCERTETVKTAIRQMLQEAQRLSATAPQRSPEERANAITFYTDAYGRLAPKGC